MERTRLNTKLPSEEIDDKLLMISDKIRFLAKSGPNIMKSSSKHLYPEYLSTLSQFRQQQYTCRPVSEHPHTLKWLLSHDTYLAWLGCSDPCMLFIHGQCGVGKTTLSSFLWKSLGTADQAEEGDAIVVLYFSFDRDDKRRNSIRSLLSSIIYQLLASQPQPFLNLRLYATEWSWWLTVKELWTILRCLVSYPIPAGVICIIDAIDQCDVPFDTTLQEFLVFSTSREANFKVVTTSRLSPGSLHSQPLFSINLDFQKDIGMDMKASINSYVRDLLQANTAFVEYENDIVEHFENQGTHLGIILSFEFLRRHTLRSTPWYIRKSLESMGCSPSGILARTISELAELPPWACTALSWIVHALRPLTLEELSLAIAIRETTTAYSEIEHDVSRDIARDLRQVFGGIFSVKHNEICFIHQSVKDYLVTHLTSPSQNALSMDLTHSDLARRCLKYLSFADIEGQIEYSPPRISDLVGYAAEYWPEHYHRAEDKERVCGAALEFLGNAKCLERWDEYRPRSRPGSEFHSGSAFPLQVAAELGLTDIVTILLSQDDGDNIISPYEKALALDMAVAHGHQEVAIQLLNDGATSVRALGLAARYGQTELARQIISRGGMSQSEIGGASSFDGALDVDRTSDSEGTSDSGDTFDSDGTSEPERTSFKPSMKYIKTLPLHTAALRGHTAVIGILLDAGAIPKSIDNSKDTPYSLSGQRWASSSSEETFGSRS